MSRQSGSSQPESLGELVVEVNQKPRWVLLVGIGVVALVIGFGAVAMVMRGRQTLVEKAVVEETSEQVEKAETAGQVSLAPTITEVDERLMVIESQVTASDIVNPDLQQSDPEVYAAQKELEELYGELNGLENSMASAGEGDDL